MLSCKVCSGLRLRELIRCLMWRKCWGRVVMMKRKMMEELKLLSNKDKWRSKENRKKRKKRNKWNNKIWRRKKQKKRRNKMLWERDNKKKRKTDKDKKQKPKDRERWKKKRQRKKLQRNKILRPKRLLKKMKMTMKGSNNSKMSRKNSNSSSSSDRSSSKLILMISIVPLLRKLRNWCRRVRNLSLQGSRRERRLVVLEWARLENLRRRVILPLNNKLIRNKE